MKPSSPAARHAAANPFFVVRALEAGLGWRAPALAVTAYAGEGDRLLALGAGFGEHLAKPIEPEALASAIANLVEQNRKSTGPPLRSE